MNLIENLKWRYATKGYDTSKKVNESDLNLIKEAIQLTATSYGLQLLKVLDVRDKAIREKLKEASWGQSQITDSSHLLVFCNYADATDEHVDEYIKLKAEAQEIDSSALHGYGDFMKSSIKNFSIEHRQIWNSKQTYIALGNAMVACAELKIDSTPMEGFDGSAYNEILGLEDKGLQASVVLAVGYRSEDDTTQHAQKVRKSIDDLFELV